MKFTRTLSALVTAGLSTVIVAGLVTATTSSPVPVDTAAPVIAEPVVVAPTTELIPATTDAPEPVVTEPPAPAPATPDLPHNPDGIGSVEAIQTTASDLWNLDRIDQPTRTLNGSYSYTSTGKGVKVFVIDTGISPHADLGARLLPGKSFVSGNASTADCHGHGTHVAGIVGATTYGVAKEVDIVPVRVYGCNGTGPNSAVTQGIDWIIANKGAGRAVVNMSLGTPADIGIANAISRAQAAGIILVGSAGNDNRDACTHFPAGKTANMIAVGATSQYDTRASFSNFGSCVNYYAPGVGIKSLNASGGTTYLGGTSQASPHVAGIVARYLQTAPTANITSIKAALTAASAGITVDKGAVRLALGIESAAPAPTPTTTAPSTTVPAPTTTVPAPTTTVAPAPTTTTVAPKPAPVLGQYEAIYNGYVYDTRTGVLLRKYEAPETVTIQPYLPIGSTIPGYTTTPRVTTPTTTAPSVTTAPAPTTAAPTPTTAAPIVLGPDEYLYNGYIYNKKTGVLIRKA